jgi:hypothetical protein
MTDKYHNGDTGDPVEGLGDEHTIDDILDEIFGDMAEDGQEELSLEERTLLAKESQDIIFAYFNMEFRDDDEDRMYRLYMNGKLAFKQPDDDPVGVIFPTNDLFHPTSMAAAMGVFMQACKEDGLDMGNFFMVVGPVMVLDYDSWQAALHTVAEAIKMKQSEAS